jgi:hypothetical protein
MQREGVAIISSGSSATLGNGVGNVFLDFSTTSASFALTLAAAPADQDVVRIMPGGTLTTGVVITLFTLSANSGQTIVGTALTSTALAAGTVLAYQYRALTSQWYRIQ